MGRCTLPKIPWFRDWYNEQFKDLCEKHDKAYRDRIPRKDADIDLMIGVIQRGYVWIGIGTYIFVRIIGRFHYARPRPSKQS